MKGRALPHYSAPLFAARFQLHGADLLPVVIFDSHPHKLELRDRVVVDSHGDSRRRHDLFERPSFVLAYNLNALPQQFAEQQPLLKRLFKEELSGLAI